MLIRDLLQTEQDAFNKANEVEHAVEDQWHYPILTKYGFTPKEKSGKGFVRSFNYEHSSGHHILVSTGASADHWSDKTNGGGGYWASLEPHLQKLNLQ